MKGKVTESEIQSMIKKLKTLIEYFLYKNLN